MATLSSGSARSTPQAGPSSYRSATSSGSNRQDPQLPPRSSATKENNQNTGSKDIDDNDAYFTLVWSGEKFRIPLPPPDAPLSTLRAAIEERTGVAPQHQKLVVGGAIMQKDLPLKTYGLVKPSLRDDYNRDDDNSRPSLGIRDMLAKWGLGNSPVANKKNKEIKITMIASKDASAIVRDRGEEGSDSNLASSGRAKGGQTAQSAGTTLQSQSQSQSQPSRHPPGQMLDEPRVVAQIDSLVTNTMDKLKPQIDTVLKPEPSQTDKEINQQYLIASEMLLQTLMKLDGFQIESQWNDARKARKDGIRRVQGLLDQIDAAKDNRRSTA